MPQVLRNLVSAILLVAVLSGLLSPCVVPMAIPLHSSSRSAANNFFSKFTARATKSTGARKMPEFALVPKALDAKLFDKDGKPFFKHFGGQTWEAGGGSHVSGKAVVNVDWKSPRSIPWQLNDVVNHPTCAERQSLNKKCGWKGGDGGGLAQWEQLGIRRNK